MATRIPDPIQIVPVDPATGLPYVIPGGSTTLTATAKATAAAPTYVEGSASNPLSTDLSGGLRITGAFAASMKATAADPTYVEGSTTNPPSVDLAGYQRSLVKQGGTWNITNISGTISLPTGAATLTAQTNVTGSKAPGTAAVNSLLAGGVYNSAGVTLTDGQQAALQFDSAGGLKVSGAGGGTQFAEDAPHASGDLGTMALGVRKDTAAALAGTDGDYQPMIFDSLGRLHVNVGAQGTGASYNPPTGGSGMVGYLSGLYAVATDPTPANVTPVPSATANGSTSSRVVAAASTNATSLKASAGNITQVDLFNVAAYDVFVKFYNKGSAPSVGTDTPVWTVPIKAGTGFSREFAMGKSFATGIAYAITKLQADSDTTVVVAGDVTGSIDWI